jgi:hypothetical protein
MKPIHTNISRALGFTKALIFYQRGINGGTSRSGIKLIGRGFRLWNVIPFCLVSGSNMSIKKEKKKVLKGKGEWIEYVS